HQQPGRTGHSHDQSAPENLRLLPHVARSPDFLSHPQLPEHLSQTGAEPLAGAPRGRQRRALHPLSTQRRTLRPEQLLLMILTAHVVVISAMLLQGCKDSTTNNTLAKQDVSASTTVE